MVLSGAWANKRMRCDQALRVVVVTELFCRRTVVVPGVQAGHEIVQNHIHSARTQIRTHTWACFLSHAQTHTRVYGGTGEILPMPADYSRANFLCQIVCSSSHKMFPSRKLWSGCIGSPLCCFYDVCEPLIMSPM